jgi:hypothetical protein
VFLPWVVNTGLFLVPIIMSVPKILAILPLVAYIPQLNVPTVMNVQLINVILSSVVYFT